MGLLLLWVLLASFAFGCCLGSKQVSQVQWTYESSIVSCNSCGSELGTPYASFVCSNFTSSSTSRRAPSLGRRNLLTDWNNGNLEFLDPIPPSFPAIIRKIDVTLIGRFNCGKVCEEPYLFLITMNTVSITSGTFPLFPNATCGCHCGNCGFPLTFTSGQQDQPGGWSAYNRGEQNILQVIIPNFENPAVICLSSVNMSITWETSIELPLALSFFPSMGPTSGLTLVNVSGFNFDIYGEYICRFGALQTIANYISSTLLQCLSPVWIGPHAPNGFTPIGFSVLLGGQQISNFSAPYSYYVQPVVHQLKPNRGPMTGGTQVEIVGVGFFGTPDLLCQFGDNEPQTASFQNATLILCNAPPWDWGEPVAMPVEISENGIDFTDNEVTFVYDDVPILGGWQLWQLIAVIAGCVAGAGLLILIVAVCLYRKARSKDRSRRYMDSDTEGETEPLISAINSKTLRQVLTKVERVEVSDLRIDRRIGRGSFGEVFHAFWAGTEIAVKKLPKHMLANQKFLEDFASEISIMAQLRHPNVLQFLGVAVDKASLFMLIEFMPRGSLYDVLHNKEIDLPVELIVSMMLDTARGMSYLHKKLVHRDLKSHNLLVDQHWTVKICDFGLARLFEPHLNTMTACGTPCWTAPEVLRNERYTEKADVYSFGIVLWECMTREDPFAGMPPFHVVFVVGTQGARPEIPKQGNWPPQLLDLMQTCWQEDPEQRPPFVDIIVVLQDLLTGTQEMIRMDANSVN